MADNGDKDDDHEGRKLTKEEAAIIEFMKRKATLEEKGGQQEQEEEKHAFWDTQPMPHAASGENLPEGPIEPNKPKEELRATPYNMPAGFEWSDIDVTNEEERSQVYELLANNYVEDDDCLFRFEYSKDFLNWALTPPGSRTEFLLGVRSAGGKQKLVAFISAVPAKVQVRDRAVEMVEINFLCVHKKLRTKRLAPVLIKEITRRVNHTGVFQAVYTAGIVLPTPVGSARYHHRSLNPKKLVNVGFSRLGPRMTMARLQKNYKLPANTSTPNLRVMTPDDVDGVHKLLTTYLKKFPLHVVFTPEEIAHWLLPREGVVNSYVVTSSDGEITDFCSYYHLPSSILGRDDTLFAVYSFYNVATSTGFPELMRDCLILAKNAGADVFNALNLMENEKFLQDLKFGLGDGNLQYYLYNWACPAMESKEVGIVLL